MMMKSQGKPNLAKFYATEAIRTHKQRTFRRVEMKRPEANRRQSERRRGESRWRDTAREMERRGGETLLERWRDEAERHCSRDGVKTRETYGDQLHSPFGQKISRADLDVTILVHIDLDMGHPWTMCPIDIPSCGMLYRYCKAMGEGLHQEDMVLRKAIEKTKKRVDMFAIGVLVLEVITSRRAVDTTEAMSGVVVNACYFQDHTAPSYLNELIRHGKLLME
uniref:Uncharacterized protein n=2 Tax=Brassica TaxID=3705 RepID=A0A0D3CK26_BRAOL